MLDLKSYYVVAFFVFRAQYFRPENFIFIAFMDLLRDIFLLLLHLLCHHSCVSNGLGINDDCSVFVTR